LPSDRQIASSGKPGSAGSRKRSPWWAWGLTEPEKFPLARFFFRWKPAEICVNRGTKIHFVTGGSDCGSGCLTRNRFRLFCEFRFGLASRHRYTISGEFVQCQVSKCTKTQSAETSYGTPSSWQQSEDGHYSRMISPTFYKKTTMCLDKILSRGRKTARFSEPKHDIDGLGLGFSVWAWAWTLLVFFLSYFAGFLHASLREIFYLSCDKKRKKKGKKRAKKCKKKMIP